MRSRGIAAPRYQTRLGGRAFVCQTRRASRLCMWAHARSRMENAIRNSDHTFPSVSHRHQRLRKPSSIACSLSKSLHIRHRNSFLRRYYGYFLGAESPSRVVAPHQRNERRKASCRWRAEEKNLIVRAAGRKQLSWL